MKKVISAILLACVLIAAAMPPAAADKQTLRIELGRSIQTAGFTYRVEDVIIYATGDCEARIRFSGVPQPVPLPVDDFVLLADNGESAYAYGVLHTDKSPAAEQGGTILLPAGVETVLTWQYRAIPMVNEMLVAYMGDAQSFYLTVAHFSVRPDITPTPDPRGGGGGTIPYPSGSSPSSAPYRIKCSRCGGDGVEMCSNCASTGKVTKRVWSTKTNSYESERFDCPSCVGGKKRCGSCHGTGYK